METKEIVQINQFTKGVVIKENEQSAYMGILPECLNIYFDVGNLIDFELVNDGDYETVLFKTDLDPDGFPGKVTSYNKQAATRS